jgi:alanine dehydrogenase
MQYYPAPEERIEMGALIEAVRSAFRDHGRGLCQMPPKTYVTLPGGDFRTMPSYLPGLGIAGVKIVNVHPDNRKHSLPSVMAVTVILDPQTGRPTAVLNATALTDLRTGASAAVATAALAPGRNGVVGLIGAGRQAFSGLKAIREVYGIDEVRIWSRQESTGSRLAAGFPDLECRVSGIEHATDADILLTTTPSRKPLVMNDWISDGTHINAIGADAPGKQELDPAILSRSTVFVDDYEQATHSGEINVPLRDGLLVPDQIAGTLGEVVIGKRGRENADQVTVFDSTGIAITDLAIASLALGSASSIDLPFLSE